MGCPYCPRIIEIMKKDDLIDNISVYKYELYEPIAKFILRNGIELMRIIADFIEKK